MPFFPRCFSIFRLSAFLVTALAVLVGAIPVGTSCAAENGAPIQATFLQLWDRHSQWTAEQWDELFQDIKTLGVKEVILQWTRITDRPFAWRLTPDNRADVPLDTVLEMPAVPLVFQSAVNHGLKVRFGLTHDPHWWEVIKNNSEIVETYLNRLLQDQIRLADSLAGRYGSHPAFAGFYIPQEIDDGTWLSPEKSKILTRHLDRLNTYLKSVLPGVRTAISCFANGTDDPRHFAAFWGCLMEKSGLDEVFIQDGVGAGKLDVGQAYLYLSAISAAAGQAGGRARPVVELFEQTGDPDRSIPASMDRIRLQLDLARRAAGPWIIAFSIPDYAVPSAGVPAERLFLALRQWAESGPASTKQAP